MAAGDNRGPLARAVAVSYLYPPPDQLDKVNQVNADSDIDTTEYQQEQRRKYLNPFRHHFPSLPFSQ